MIKIKIVYKNTRSHVSVNNNTQTSEYNLNHYPPHANNQKSLTQNEHIPAFDSLFIVFSKTKPDEKIHYPHGFSLVLCFDFLHSKQALIHKQRTKPSKINILVEFLSRIPTHTLFCLLLYRRSNLDLK
ncbi:hypothetical protein H705_00322 [Bartonella bacilliformis Cond044]|nr:hypothetical protein H705_00322 [Bartonella bacilliformis Cond044]